MNRAFMVKWIKKVKIYVSILCDTNYNRSSREQVAFNLKSNLSNFIESG